MTYTRSELNEIVEKAHVEQAEKPRIVEKPTFSGVSWNWLGLIRYQFKKNAEILAILCAFFVFTEGIIIVKRPNLWWIPLTISLCLFFLVFAWNNCKYVLKSLLSTAVMIVVCAFQMIFATAYMADPNKGLLLPSSTVCSFFIFLSLSYLIDRNISRWNAAIVGCLFAFSASYGFIQYGLIPSIIANCVTIFALSLGYMLLRGIFSRRSSNMPKNSGVSNDYVTQKIVRATETAYETRIFKDKKQPFYLLLPKKEENSEDSGKTEKTIAILPLDFENPILPSAKTHIGLTYSHRRIGGYFYKLAARVRNLTDPSVIILFGDVKGGLNRYDIISIDLVDTQNQLNIGLIDLSTKARIINSDITSISKRFIYPTLKPKTVAKLRKNTEPVTEKD